MDQTLHVFDVGALKAVVNIGASLLVLHGNNETKSNSNECKVQY